MKLTFRPPTRAELDLAIEWAAAEGWNPGLHDAEIFWKTDPEGFIGMEKEGELVATGAIISYGGCYGFMGLFIVKKGLRRQGIGTPLWFHRRDLLRSRLAPGAAIGMDGVFEMQDWYARGGFVFSHRNLRMEGLGKASPRNPDVCPLSEIPSEKVAAYDRECFGCLRDKFLNLWITQPDSLALGFKKNENLLGFGVIRKCRVGYKIGPLFADTPEVAEALFTSLANHAAGETISLGIPENHPDAMALAARHGLTEVFGCARMYHGSPPKTDGSKIFGITTFELG